MRKLPVPRFAVRVVAGSLILCLVIGSYLAGQPLPLPLIGYLCVVFIWLEIAVTLANSGPPSWPVQWLTSTGSMAMLCGMVWLSWDYWKYALLVLGMYVAVVSIRLGLAGSLYISGIASVFLGVVAAVRPDRIDWFNWALCTLALASTAFLLQDFRLQSLAGLFDPLTELYNRRALDQYMRDRLRNFKMATVIICDMDGLKQINDTYGHNAGDAALSLVAKTLLRHVHASDFVCRLGGDEFLIILTDTDLGEARQILEDIRVDLKSHANITVSFGVALYPRDGETLRDVMAAADAALYEAKRKRNSLAVARGR